MKTLLLSLIVVISFSVQGQITEEIYFSDTAWGFLDQVFDHVKLDDGMIVSGAIDTDTTVEPVIVKLNLNGEVVWSTFEDTKLGTWNCQKFNIEFYEDGFVYGVSYETNLPIWKRTIWKVNAVSGDVIWTSLFYANTPNNSVSDMVDYDSARFLLSYFVTWEGPIVAFIDKYTGDTLSTKVVNPIGGPLGNKVPQLEVDYNGNIFCSSHSYFYKFNGDNLNFPIWARSYAFGANTLGQIQEVYLDEAGQLFLMGEEDGDFDGIVQRVSSMSGEIIWLRNAVQDEVRFQDFKDKFGKLFITYEPQSFVGNNFQTTVSIRKSDGHLLWESNQSQSDGIPGSDQSALSLDVDCEGNVFQTGYFEWGRWGAMRLNWQSGFKPFDLTVSDNLTYNDTESRGVGAVLYENSPVIIGNLEAPSGDVTARYVTFDPTNGDLEVNKKIGSRAQFHSSAKQIINHNDSIYALKQHGSNVSISAYDINGSLFWEYIEQDSAYSEAGNLAVVNDQLFFTIASHQLDSVAPFYADSIDEIRLIELDRMTGNMTTQNTLVISDEMHLFGLISNATSSFLFYTKNQLTSVLKWDGTAFLPEVVIEPSGISTTSKNAQDLILDFNANKILFAGSSALIGIDKNTLGLSTEYGYSTQRAPYALQEVSSELAIVGEDSGTQFFTMIDTSSMLLSWENTYDTGVFYGLEALGDTVFVHGVSQDSIQVQKLSRLDGSSFWSFSHQNTAGSTSESYDLELLPSKEMLVISGSELNQGASADALIEIVNSVVGISLYEDLRPDEIGQNSFSGTSCTQSTDKVWIGGALNRITFGKEGFIYILEPNDSLNQEDCTGLIQGTAYIDSCGTCVEGLTGQLPCVQDCNLDWGGNAFIDSCGICAGGNTGVIPVLNPIDCFNSINELSEVFLEIVPNPSSNSFTVIGIDSDEYKISLYDLSGKLILSQRNQAIVEAGSYARGAYIVEVRFKETVRKLRVLLVQ